MRRLMRFHARKAFASLAATLLLAANGCSALNPYGPSSVPISPPPTIVIPAQTSAPPSTTLPPDAIVGASTIIPESTAVVPISNPDWAWDQIVDVVDDYFKISQEDRVKADMLAPGRIDTFPVTGATIFEPWRKDSVNLAERWECTLQSIQRRASIQVIPNDPFHYTVDVSVWKELEDCPKPMMASAGAATFRYDTSLQRDTEFDPDQNRIPGDPARPVGPRTPTAGWIYLGRDVGLEHEILAKIQTRLGCGPNSGATPTVVPALIGTPPPQYIAPGPIVPPTVITPQPLPSP